MAICGRGFPRSRSLDSRFPFLMNAWRLYDTSSRAFYFRLGDGGLTVFGGEIRPRAYRPSGRSNVGDGVWIRTDGDAKPIWTFTVFRNQPGQARFKAPFRMEQYPGAAIGKASATEMDYRFMLHGGRAVFDYFAAVVDTTSASWKEEVYALIGRALEGFESYLSESSRSHRTQ